MVKMPVNWTVAFFCAAVIDFASRPLDGCVITISLIGLSPFLRYSVTHTLIQMPIVVMEGEVMVLPINRGINDDAGQSDIAIGNWT